MIFAVGKYGKRIVGMQFLDHITVRIIGASVRLSAELNNPPNTEELVMAFSFEAAGLGPLLMCTTSLLGIVSVIPDKLQRIRLIF